METLYITDNGLLLKKKSNRILICKDGKRVEELPVLDLKRILIFGSNQVSTDLMQFLAMQGIELAFLTLKGRYKFRLVPETSKNIFLRMAQHERYHDLTYKTETSRIIIRAKLRNQRSLLVRYQRNQPDIEAGDVIGTLRTCTGDLERKETIEEMMGVEGYGARVYYSAYGKFLGNGFRFEGRKYHPPPDPVNALLGFGYMILFTELDSLLEAHGFDVFIGFLHTIQHGRNSLALDLMEELRSPVIDRLVLYLINKGVIKKAQFSSSNGGKGVLMDEAAKRAFIRNYEKFMTSPFKDPQSQQMKDFRQILKERVTGFEKSIISNQPYEAYNYY